MSGRHVVPYVAQCVACAALTLVAWQQIANLSTDSVSPCQVWPARDDVSGRRGRGAPPHIPPRGDVRDVSRTPSMSFEIIRDFARFFEFLRDSSRSFEVLLDGVCNAHFRGDLRDEV